MCTILACLSITIAASSCGSSGSRKTSAGEVPAVRLLLSFVHDMQNVHYYWTQDNEWDKQCGYNLDIKTAEGVENPLQLLLAGEVDVALIDPLSYVFAREKDLPVMAIGEDVAKTPVAYVSKASSDISGPEDLPGHTVGVQPGGDSEWYLDKIMRASLSEEERSNVKVVSTGFSMKPLMTDKIDVYSMWPTNTDINTLITQGHEFDVMRAYDYGIETMGNLIVVDRRDLEKRRDLYTRFLATTATGLSQSLDPDYLDEAIAATKKRLQRDVPRSVYSKVYDELQKVRTGPVWDRNGVAANDATAYEASVAIAKDQGEVANDATFDNLYTNSLLDDVMTDGEVKSLEATCK